MFLWREDPNEQSQSIWYPTTDIEGEIGSYLYGIDEEVLKMQHRRFIHKGYPIHLHSMDTKVGEQPVPS